jgi:hypothetical protein
MKNNIQEHVQCLIHQIMILDLCIRITLLECKQRWSYSPGA